MEGTVVETGMGNGIPGVTVEIVRASTSRHNPFNLRERDFAAPPVVELRCGRRGVAGDVLRVFKINGVTWWYPIHSTYNVPQSSGGADLL